MILISSTDVALQIVEDCPKLLENVDNVDNVANVYLVLGLLGQKPDAFKRVEKNLISRIMDPCKHYIYL